MTIGIVGLGLIGGSAAKAIKKYTEHTVFGYDLSPSVVESAVRCGAIDKELSKDELCLCDMTIIALYPGVAIEYITENQALFKKGSIVTDCCGIKRQICAAAEPIARENGFYFVGGHPMAGSQFSGFKYSRESLFTGASMILVPRDRSDISLIGRLKELFSMAGFSRVMVCDAEYHDRMIAYTSQLAHVVSNAYVKSPCAKDHRGFSAGSLRDLTRVAKLNENMWTELFFENRDNLCRELDILISSLEEYRRALDEGDREKMRRLLAEGRAIKEGMDKRQ